MFWVLVISCHICNPKIPFKNKVLRVPPWFAVFARKSQYLKNCSRFMNACPSVAHSSEKLSNDHMKWGCMIFNDLLRCFYLISKLSLLVYQRKLSVVFPVLPTTSNLCGDHVFLGTCVFQIRFLLESTVS